MKSISSVPGATLFRWVTSLVLIFILVVYFFSFIDGLDARLREIRQQTVINELNFALSGYLYSATIEGNLSRISTLQNKNPFNVLAGDNYQPPVEYIGEVDSHHPVMESGWYFDRDALQIVFAEGNKQVRYRLIFLYHDYGKNNEFDPGEDVITKLTFEMV